MAAKRRLASFSIETDQQVLINFDDGTAVRLQRSELRGRLEADDYTRVAQAFRVRQSFWRRHLPKGLMVAVAGATAAIAVLVTNGRPLLHIVTPHEVSSAQPAGEVEAAKTIATPSPRPSASPSPSAVSSGSPATARRPIPAARSHRSLLRRLTDALGKW